MNAAGDGDVIGYVFSALGIVGGALLLSTAGIYALIAATTAACHCSARCACSLQKR